jgi:hypothetical protein
MAAPNLRPALKGMNVDKINASKSFPFSVTLVSYKHTHTHT